ncbi:MAG TPA: 30S ribosome-binding factor RbfA [Candidatus Limnocylindrales bacterium]|nr:30S ribosome-binding factor RbfA [Candidatus Limnocylindrales bacterium]
MTFKRADRVNALLQRELGTLISEELRDPRIFFPTVTSVDCTSDLRSARVHVSVLGDEDQITSTMTALIEARAYLRRELGARTDLRHVPDLTFVSDRTAEQSARISTLLRQAREQEGES